MRLPGRFGGLSLRCGGEVEAAAAYWSSWATRQHALPGLTDAMGWQTTKDPDEGYAQALGRGEEAFGEAERGKPPVPHDGVEEEEEGGVFGGDRRGSGRGVGHSKERVVRDAK